MTGSCGSGTRGPVDRIAARAGHRGPIVDVRFSPTGHLVVTAGVDGTARLWQSDGTPEGVLGPRSKGLVSMATFSPDGAFVVTAEQGIARVWRTADRSLDTILRGHKPSDSVCGLVQPRREPRRHRWRRWDGAALGCGDRQASEDLGDRRRHRLGPCRRTRLGRDARRTRRRRKGRPDLAPRPGRAGPGTPARYRQTHRDRDQSRRQARRSGERRRNDPRRRREEAAGHPAPRRTGTRCRLQLRREVGDRRL